MSNPYAAAARVKKAAALADLLSAHRITAEEARRIDWGLWPQLAQRAGVRAPSPETVEQVIEALEAREAAVKSGGVL
jgi:hypothetical protein